jgi:hypothetical protein
LVFEPKAVSISIHNEWGCRIVKVLFVVLVIKEVSSTTDLLNFTKTATHQVSFQNHKRRDRSMENKKPKEVDLNGTNPYQSNSIRHDARTGLKPRFTQ